MPSLETGKRIVDRYLLQERLGDGGHAEVWAALDGKSQQRVALKFLHADSCDIEDAWHVLQHEADMAQRLEHPGVLRIAPPQRDGRMAFLPMEYASGGDAGRLRGAHWQTVLPVLVEVATILEHAHSRGVVHRDIKPGNVLFDAQGRVRLTDFGTAARTGSSAALSAGSPYSASPQQLRGEPATTADDVYGLGALAYELLSAYPPYFPAFDAARVQHENPPPLVPSHPAPAGLANAVMVMLARDAADRPTLQSVLQQFAAIATSTEGTEASLAATHRGTAQIVEAPQADARVPPVPASRRRLPTWLWLATAAGAAALVFTLLPQPQQQRTVPVPDVATARQSEPAPARVPAVATAPDHREDLARELRDAASALAAQKPAAARAAFRRALVIDPGSAVALRGVESVSTLERLLQHYSDATRAEARGDLDQAATGYAAVLRQDPSFNAARSAQARVHKTLDVEHFEAELSSGATALRNGQLPQAQVAYARAAARYPEEPRVIAGLARLAQVQRNQRNAADLATGADLERTERWSDAVAHYREVLGRDAALLFAQDGLARSERRATLDLELADYLARPARLTAGSVRVAAERALARGDAATPRTARLDGQLAQLRTVLHTLAAAVRIAIASDNNTLVSVAPLGDLGAFMLRELELPPGRYTLVGRRDGYRDVRHELDIAPGQQATTVTVQCTERI